MILNGDTLQEVLIAGGLAILGMSGGIYAAALRAYSRSRLEDFLKERGEEMSAWLRQTVEDEYGVRLSATLWHALAIGGFLIYTGVTHVAPRVPPAGEGWWPAAGWCVLLLGLAGVMRAIAVLVGEAAPERLVYAVGGFACILTFPLKPLVRAILGMRTVVARGLGRETEKSEEDREEEVMAAVSDGVLNDVVEAEQKEMIESIFELKDADIADILTPRTDMISIEASSSLSEAIRLALEKGHSRLPVHETTRDNVIGIFYVRDALQYWEAREAEPPTLREILRKPIFVPETKKVSELLREMQRDKIHLCVVLDEYGGTAGLVTIEDVLEEIVGEIQDEFDEDENGAEIRSLDDVTVVADAHVHVHEINEALDMDLIPEDDDYETLAGFVLDELGHIPQVGETFTYKSLHIEVMAADERKVDRVKVHRDRDAEETV